MNHTNMAFSVSLVASLVVHLPLYHMMGAYYFPQHKPALVEKHKEPVFVYTPQRDVSISRVVTFSKVSHGTKQSSPDRAKETIERTQKRTPPVEKRSPVKISPSQHPLVENLDMGKEEIRKAFMNYYQVLSGLIAQFAVYPEEARAQMQEGVSYIAFVLRPSGNLGEIVLRESSGSPLLDRAAMSAVQNAAPFPPVPQDLIPKSSKDLRLHVPIAFELE